MIIREIKRDYAYEEEMIFLVEKNFGEDHAGKNCRLRIWRMATFIMDSARKHFGPKDSNAPTVDEYRHGCQTDASFTASGVKEEGGVHSKQIDKELQRSERNVDCRDGE